MSLKTLKYPGRWWHKLDGERVQCDLCPRHCRLRDGQKGFCFVRECQDGAMVLTAYGRSSGFCIDPIEKKPLNHFFPGTTALSFGTAGCNLGCRFCQNWDISKARQMDRLCEEAPPETIALSARKNGCQSVAFTYNDPVVFAEYAIDTAIACHEQDVRTVAVTAGYITSAARADFFEHMDAANVDLKAFHENFYKELCFAQLAPVLETLKYLHDETDCWLEITTLLIPGQNDSNAEMHAMTEWIVENLGPDVPLHFSAFHPDFKLTDLQATPPATLQRARRIAQKAGIRFVYTGNIHDPKSGNTWCPSCGALLIERDWYQLGEYHIHTGQCDSCGAKIPGRFTDTHDWTTSRRPMES